MDRVLVVDDDCSIQRTLKRLFEPEGFAVEVASDGPSALAALRNQPANVVVLDLRLPGMPGRDVCREMKQQFPAVPIIILSAATDVMDKVLLLELGADDYVTKPFSPRELLARVRTVVRRSRRHVAEDVVQFADVSVDIARMQATRAGQIVPLTVHEFKILKFMVQNPERVISREELLNEALGYRNYPLTRAIDNHLLKLRQKLEIDPSNPVHFRTVYAAGYRFVP